MVKCRHVSICDRFMALDVVFVGILWVNLGEGWLSSGGVTQSVSRVRRGVCFCRDRKDCAWVTRKVVTILMWLKVVEWEAVKPEWSRGGRRVHVGECPDCVVAQVGRVRVRRSAVLRGSG